MANAASSVTIHAPEGHLAPRETRVADARLARVLAGDDTLIFDGAMGT